MLGVYNKGAAPFHFLTQPHGTNIWNDAVKKILNGKYDMSKGAKDYAAYGWVHVPEDTTLFVEAGAATNVKLNGLGYDVSNGGKWHGVDIEFKKGLYKVEVSTVNNGGQLPGCGVKITDKNANVELPVFFSDEALNVFSKSLKPGSIELSAWEGKRIVVPIPKK